MTEYLFELPVGRTIPSRSTDPDTSHEAARQIRVTANNQRGKLLVGYRWVPRGLTDEEAQVRAGVSPLSCYWKRCSELREAGLIETTGETRKGRSGVLRMVCALTPDGLRVLAGLDLELEGMPSWRVGPDPFMEDR
jgi:hypothetical protein